MSDTEKIEAGSIKPIKSKFGSSLRLTIPMIEELVDKGMIPFGVIGSKINKKEKAVEVWFSTVNNSDEILEHVYTMCKSLVNELAERFEKEQPEHPRPFPLCLDLLHTLDPGQVEKVMYEAVRILNEKK